jgi:hypothetical protein
MELRQFAYLDDLAVRSLLASKNIPVPDDITEVNEAVKEGEGGGNLSLGLNIPYIGSGEGKVNLSGSKTGRELLETSKRINDQFIFDILYNELENDVTDMTEDSDRCLSEGDLVKIEGVANTDAIFRLLTIMNTYSELFEEQEGQVQQAYDLLYGDSVGISLEVEDSRFSYGMRLKPEKLWIDQTQAFLGTKKYSVYGRIYDTIGGDDKWDYLNIVEVIDSILDDDTMNEVREVGSQFIRALGEAQQDVELPDVASAGVERFEDLEDLGETTKKSSFSLDVEDREIALEGPGFVIYPIAIYW